MGSDFPAGLHRLAALFTTSLSPAAMPRHDGSLCCRFALTLLAFIVDIAFALSLGGLLGMHTRMVWLNVTTIEMFEKQRVTQWPFDRGPTRNFQEVFGTRCGLTAMSIRCLA